MHEDALSPVGPQPDQATSASFVQRGHRVADSLVVVRTGGRRISQLAGVFREGELCGHLQLEFFSQDRTGRKELDCLLGQQFQTSCEKRRRAIGRADIGHRRRLDPPTARFGDHAPVSTNPRKIAEAMKGLPSARRLMTPMASSGSGPAIDSTNSRIS